MEKPNADIEWCEGGYTMEEQALLRSEYNKDRLNCKLTDRFKSDAADKLISSLTVNIAASEEYIAELEEDLAHERANVSELEAKYADLENKYKTLCNKYSVDMKLLRSEDELYQNLRLEISSLKAENANLKDVRDNLIYQLNAKA